MSTPVQADGSFSTTKNVKAIRVRTASSGHNIWISFDGWSCNGDIFLRFSDNPEFDTQSALKLLMAAKLSGLATRIVYTDPSNGSRCIITEAELL
ncbi:MAG: hypothetical protein QNJ97_21900 [Myxococcota bacterium]|nr:hypothetical protein [Myxococcota bacterium]